MMTPEQDRAFRVMTGEAADPHAHRLLNLPELVAMADIATPWRCDKFAADGYLTILSGRGGEGKSLFTLGLAGGVLVGSAVAGIDCAAGTVCIFDAENGPKLIGRRVKEAGLLHPQLRVYDSDGLDLVADRDWIAEQLQGVNLVVFDSLRSLAPTGARENDSDDMAPIIVALRRLARTTGAAVVLVHHRGKDQGQDFRGSEAIRDMADMLFVLERHAKDPDARWRRAVRCVKCRIDEEPEERWLGIRRQRGELFFTEAAPFNSDRAAPRRDQVEQEVINILRRDGATRRADVARKLGREPSDRTVRRVFDDLKDAGRIAPIGDTWQVVIGADDKATSCQVVSLSACRPTGDTAKRQALTPKGEA
jgi:hypothetical protein